MTLQKAKLTVDADVDGDGSAETGIFEFEGNLNITTGIRTGFIIENRGSTINSVVSSNIGNGESKRRGVFLDLGGGTHYVEVNFRGWEGSPGQWGDDGTDDGVSKTDATGAGPVSQLDVLKKYLLVGEFDSRGPATLEYGEYSSSGVYEPLDVVVEAPQSTKAAEDGSWFDGSITFLEVIDMTGGGLDGSNRKEY